MHIKKIQVVCPFGVVTGGPESLHNLVALCRNIGEDAEIVYYPFSAAIDTPTEYRNYGVKSGTISDAHGTLVILPEILCFEGKKFLQSAVAIWWLSVDNFREKKYHNWRDPFRYIKKCFVDSRWAKALCLNQGFIADMRNGGVGVARSGCMLRIRRKLQLYHSHMLYLRIKLLNNI
jgi:hypothetical protein